MPPLRMLEDCEMLRSPSALDVDTIVLWIHLSRPLIAVAALVLATVANVAAGQSTRPRFDCTGVGDTSVFAPLVLPAASVYRAGSGARSFDGGDQFEHVTQIQGRVRIPSHIGVS